MTSWLLPTLYRIPAELENCQAYRGQPDRTAWPIQKVYLYLYRPLPRVSRYNTLKILPGRKGELATQEEMKNILSVEDDWYKRWI